MPSSAQAYNRSPSLSLPDALPIFDDRLQRVRIGLGVDALDEERRSRSGVGELRKDDRQCGGDRAVAAGRRGQAELLLGGLAEVVERSEEHTSELQSHSELVCRLLLRLTTGRPLFHYPTLFRSSTIDCSASG